MDVIDKFVTEKDEQYVASISPKNLQEGAEAESIFNQK